MFRHTRAPGCPSDGSLGFQSISLDDLTPSEAGRDGFLYTSSSNAWNNASNDRLIVSSTDHDDPSSAVASINQTPSNQLRPRFGPATVVVLLLALYSTILSGLWLVIAIIQPRWGFTVSTTRGFSPSNAATLTALFAKTIEVASVAVFTSCLGQILTRRAVAEKSPGITLADITVRNWVIQPGFIFTHFRTLVIAGRTLLGTLSLLTLITAILYTTASEVLVSPKLKHSKWETRELTVPVHSYYGNYVHAAKRCTRKGEDSLLCLYQEFNYMSARDFLAFTMGYDRDADLEWAAKQGRVPWPTGRTLLHGNITMEATRVDEEFSDVASLYERWGRLVQNVTLSLPHPSVWAASRLPSNKILHPEDLSQVGGFSVKAAVVSPTLNTLCVNMSEGELAPLVYQQFPQSHQTDLGSWVQAEIRGWDNSTVVDELFRWGTKFGRRRPIFESIPTPGTIIYHRHDYPFDGHDAGYLITSTVGPGDHYALCQLRSWLSTDCSTHLNVSGVSQPTMHARCGEVDDDYRYDPSAYASSDRDEAPELWTAMLSLWRTAILLEQPNQKNFSAAFTIASSALRTSDPRRRLVSTGELLSALLLPTLTLSALDTQVRHTWDHGRGKEFVGANETRLNHDFNTTETFRAGVRSQEYTSGHTDDWQGLFYLVLGFAFALNLLCLGYLFSSFGLIDDITEPQNHFSLAMISSPCPEMDGSFPDGPEKQHWEVQWRVCQDSANGEYYLSNAAKRF